jgi:hypothetical protein
MYIACLLVAVTTTGTAQVGINTSNISDKAMLEVFSEDRGILIPRLSQTEIDALILTTADQNGMFVYNTSEDCFNYWSVDEQGWLSLCGNDGIAKFNCTSVNLHGTYRQDQTVDARHYISIEVTVSRKGLYSIAASVDSPVNDNGYFFYLSGFFAAVGTYTLSVPAVGKPLRTGIDHFVLSLNGVKASGACNFNITVGADNSSIHPDYEINCSSVKVYGTYKRNVPLDNSHYIELSLTNVQAPFGAEYIIETTTIDGMHFKGTGTLTGATMNNIRLYGEGSPTSVEDKDFTILTNSDTPSYCHATVFITIPRKKVLALGSGIYNVGNNYRFHNFFVDTDNFGPYEYSIVKCEGFDITTISAGVFLDNTTNSNNYYASLYGENAVDMVITGYSWTPRTTRQADSLANFVHRGGILIMYNEDDYEHAYFLRQILGKSDVALKDGSSAGSIYRYVNIDDEILNGPFGNIAGLQSGEDATITHYVHNLPLEDVVLYTDAINRSTATPPAREPMSATSFRHRSLPFVWNGDGGFNSCNTGTSATAYPFRVNSKTINGHTYSLFPVGKPDYGTSSSHRFTVYNSTFTANAIAWALKQAERYKASIGE